MAMVIQHRQHYRVSQRDYKKKCPFILLSAAVEGKDEGGYGACEETRDCCTC